MKDGKKQGPPHHGPHHGPPHHGPHHHGGAPHHYGHHHHHYRVAEVLGPLKESFNGLATVFESEAKQAWVTRLCTFDAPPHRHVRNTFILSLLSEVIRMAAVNGDVIEMEPVFGTSPHEYGFEFPIGVPVEIMKMLGDGTHDELLRWLGDGPIHEVAMDLTLIKGLTTVLKAMQKGGRHEIIQ